VEDPLVPHALLQHGQFVRALAQALLRDAHAAEDVAQETWARYLQRPPVEDRGLRSWFRTVVRNQAANAGRSAFRRAARERRAARPEAVEGAEHELEQGEMLSVVVEAVLALDEPYRETILARYWRGLDVAEVAVKCSVSAVTVRSREQHALEKLRRRLDRRSGGERAAWAAALARIAGPPEVESGGGPKVERSSPATKLAAILGALFTCVVGLRWIGSSTRGTEDEPLPAALQSETMTTATQGDQPRTGAKADDSSSARDPLTAIASPSFASASPTYAIKGILRHSRDGRPMARVILSLHNDALRNSEPDLRPIEVETDDDGRFSVALSEGLFRAEIHDSTDNSVYPQIEPFFCIPRKSQELELSYVDPDAWLEVQVVANGIPFANAEIESHLGNLGGYPKTDHRGKVMLGFPETGPGKKLSLVASGHNKQLISVPVTVSERPPEVPLVLELEPSAHLTVHLMYGNGAPVRDCSLDAAYERDPSWPGWSTRTNAVGVGVLALPAGRYSIYLNDSASTQVEKEVDLDWGSDVNLDLQFADVALAVSGSVIDERGAPLADVHLEVDWPEDSVYEDLDLGEASTDGDGSFVFHKAGSGVLRLTTEKDLLGDRFEPSAVDVPFGTRDVLFRRVDSRPLAILQVEVVAAHSLEHPKFVQPVLFRPPSNYSYTLPLYGGLGTIDVKGYPDLSVEFRAVGFRQRTIPVANLLAANGIQRVVLEPGFEGNVLVQDRDGDHPPIAGALVMDGDVCLATADANGRIVLGLDHWPDKLIFTAPGYEPEEWRQERWLGTYDEAVVWLVHSDPGKDH